MPPKKWIAKAVVNGKGKFAAKARRAGVSTKKFAQMKERAPGKLGKEARLAMTLSRLRPMIHAGAMRAAWGSGVRFKRGGLVRNTAKSRPSKAFVEAYNSLPGQRVGGMVFHPAYQGLVRGRDF
jgi:hypothetical protein